MTHERRKRLKTNYEWLDVYVLLFLPLEGTTDVRLLKDASEWTSKCDLDLILDTPSPFLSQLAGFTCYSWFGHSRTEWRFVIASVPLKFAVLDKCVEDDFSVTEMPTEKIKSDITLQIIDKLIEHLDFVRLYVWGFFY